MTTSIERLLSTTALALCLPWCAMAADIRGRVVDKLTREPLIGASVMAQGGQGVTTNIDGCFHLMGLKAGKHSLTVRYVAYQTLTVEGAMATNSAHADTLLIEMQEANHELGDVVVTAMVLRNTEAAMIEAAKVSPVIVNNISAQEIQRAQDSNAGEVIRRVPGVSLIDDKFVMVRGLSQRYNNVWINGGAVPSSEPDSRAFSFDILPSSQIDNLVIVKSPSPEYPADFSGGFIKINTKDIPARNTFSISVGGNVNDATHFSPFLYAKGSPTDWLGFDSGMRGLDGGIGAPMTQIAGVGIDLTANGLNNDWRIRRSSPWADMKMGADFSHRWQAGRGQLGMIGAVNYSNERRTLSDMQNNLFGVYDEDRQQSTYLRHSVDCQYNHNVRLGALANVTYLSPSGNHKYELKNIFNQLATDRYTWREGISAQSDNEHSAEYFYRSRTTYNAQLMGQHTIGAHQTDWSASYSYSNRMQPDRRRYLVNDALDSGQMALSTGNDIQREHTAMHEHIASAAANHSQRFAFGSFEPSIKVGAYGEYRSREYHTRQFMYGWNTAHNTLPTGFRQMDMTELLSNPKYFGAEGLYMLEHVDKTNDYGGRNTMGAAYVALDIPLGRVSLHGGLRFEHNRMELIYNTYLDRENRLSRIYNSNDLFPSVNITYRMNNRHQWRLSYGKSVNRPEFRELSASVYYDFDLASNVQGNPGLQPCYVHNVDLRYEFYPAQGEQITITAFYKHFDNPIEWAYTVAGGTSLVYSYINALSADNYGLELDVRKRLDFMGLPEWGLSLNASLIKSSVNFPAGSREHDRPMQGQSPYLVNGALFYQGRDNGLAISLMYNRIGKRIIGVGRSEGTTNDGEQARIPDSYEMPRDVLDLSLSKKFGCHWELKAAVRDLLAQRVNYKQFAQTSHGEVEEITRRYKPGRNISLQLTYKF